MKPPQIVREIRALFGFLRITSLLFLVACPFAAFVPVREPHLAWTIPLVWSPPAPAVDPKEIKQLEVTDVSATIAFQPASANSMAVWRWTLIPAYALRSAFLFLLFHLLWRICKNVEQGEVFIEKNLRMVRALGFALLAYTLLQSFVKLWVQRRVAEFLTQHLTSSDLHVMATSDLAGLIGRYRLDGELIIVALVALGIAEVFRRGLDLQKEAELTI